jgi:hypothetical protein
MRSGAAPSARHRPARGNVVRARHARFWFIQDTNPSLLLGLLTFTIHVFRMTTFS